ncbi:MAG: GNAT family N-acetyltransferase [Phycisphaerales bacterium]|nr:GNAT family N-acetyltransferase [Phycisphaerales bacterium]
MASLTGHIPTRDDAFGEGWAVVPVPTDDQALELAAIARLLPNRGDEHALRQAAEDFRLSVLEGSLAAIPNGASTSSLPNPGTPRLFAAMERASAGPVDGYGDGLPARLGQTAMVVPAVGRTAGVYLSPEPLGGMNPFEVLGIETMPGGPGVRQAQRIALAAHIRQWLAGVAKQDGVQIDLAQALIELGQEQVGKALLAAGFTRLAELAYLRRDIPRYGRVETPDTSSLQATDIRVVNLSTLTSEIGAAAADELLLEAMSASYQQTLDCPLLCEIRRPSDVLASHRSVGVHDPTLWFVLLRREGQRWAGAGCMLLSPFAEHQTVELVYLGLGPSVRGRGLAGALMGLGLDLLQSRGTRCLACAVDMANTPAMNLYKRLKFRAFARRVGYIADVRGQKAAGS